MKTNRQTAKAFIYGLCANGSNCHTDGTTFVSYETAVATNRGKCILIACAYRACNWCGAIFGTTPTTEKQLSYVVREASYEDIPTFRVPNIYPRTEKDHATNIEHLTAKMNRERERADKARREDTKKRYLFFAGAIKTNIALYKAIFNIA